MNEPIYWLLAGLAVGIVIAVWRRVSSRRSDALASDGDDDDDLDAEAQAAERAEHQEADEARLENERRERKQRELEARDKAEREKAERERADREKTERERAEHRRAERQRVERDKAERAAHEEAKRQAEIEAQRRAEDERQASMAARLEAADRAAAAKVAEEQAAAQKAASDRAAADREAALRAAPVAAPPRVPTAPAAAANGFLVMVADDSKVARVKAGRLLSQYQYRVCYANDGNDAAKQLEAEQPDVVITDNDMPGMDGFALTRHIRSNPGTAHIPVIMITAANDRHREMADASGVSVLLGKPYEDAALIESIHSAIGQRAPRAH